MDFLNRRKSLAFPGDVDSHKPLPTLPPLPAGLMTTRVGAVENIPTKRPDSSHSASDIIKRVSNIFSSRKKRPPALQLRNGTLYENRNSSLQSLSDSEDDDIRRPSGLGSAASFTSNRSLPPSPFTPSHDLGDYISTGYTRSTSTPNLLRSLSVPITLTSPSPRRKRTFKDVQYTVIPAKPITTINDIPIETIVLILSHLSKSEVALVARTNRLFCSATRTILYTDVDLSQLSHVQLEKFIALLASRRELTDLVRTFKCYNWPMFFVTSSSSTSPSPSTPIFNPITGEHHNSDLDTDVQHRNTLLTATFTLAFQRMANLTEITLPAYDHDLLAHHSAFGLKSITFSCSSLSIGEANEMFAWLDGQTNVTTLLFPKLVMDRDYGSTPNTPVSSIPPVLVKPRNVSTPPPSSSNGLSKGEKKFLVAPYLIPFPTTDHTKSNLPPRPKTTSSPSTTSFDPDSTPPLPLPSPIPTTPISPSSNSSLSPDRYNGLGLGILRTNLITTNIKTATQFRTSPLSSPTLLPNLTTLQGPPSLIIALTSLPTNTNTNTNTNTSPNSSSFPNSNSNSTNNNRNDNHNHNYNNHNRTNLSIINNHPRPSLKSVTININSTIYSGLRPNAIMINLIGRVRKLGLEFSENVDKRSVEKVLGAAGSALGGVRSESEFLYLQGNKDLGLGGEGEDGGGGGGEERQREGKDVSLRREFRFGEGSWRGIVDLEIKFGVGSNGVLPGSDERFHKMINSVIPRYPFLRSLRLSYQCIPLPPLPPHPSLSLSPLSPSSPLSPLSQSQRSSSSPTHYTPDLLNTDNSSNSFTTSPLHLPITSRTTTRNSNPTPTSSTPNIPISIPSRFSDYIYSSRTNSLMSNNTTSTTSTNAGSIGHGPSRNSYSSLIGPYSSSGSGSGTPTLLVRKEVLVSPPEQAYIRQWIKHCPELQKVVFLSGSVWVKK